MNFEEMIRARLNDGASLEDLAAEFGGLLNKVQAETNKSKDEKTEYLENLELLFMEHYDKMDDLTMHDLSALAVLIMEGSYPNWTIEDMQEFREAVEASVRTIANLQGKSLKDVAYGLFDTHGKRENGFMNLFDSFLTGN